MECVRRAVAVEIENPPSELYAVEEQYRRIVEEVAAYVAERGRLEKEKYNELYRRFRKLYHLPAQLIQQAINQGVETGRSFLQRKTAESTNPAPRWGGSPSALPKTAGAPERRRPQPPPSKSPYRSTAGGERSG
jgi:hypothetical protein